MQYSTVYTSMNSVSTATLIQRLHYVNGTLHPLTFSLLHLNFLKHYVTQHKFNLTLQQRAQVLFKPLVLQKTLTTLTTLTTDTHDTREQRHSHETHYSMTLTTLSTALPTRSTPLFLFVRNKSITIYYFVYICTYKAEKDALRAQELYLFVPIVSSVPELLKYTGSPFFPPPIPTLFFALFAIKLRVSRYTHS